MERSNNLELKIMSMKKRIIQSKTAIGIFIAFSCAIIISAIVFCNIALNLYLKQIAGISEVMIKSGSTSMQENADIVMRQAQKGNAYGGGTDILSQYG